jgi:aryl-alcohol dehydrogenase-like predicted oxidoreductase
LLNEISGQKNASAAQIALAWLLAQKTWIVPIPGTTKQARLIENMGAVNVMLTVEEINNIDKAFALIPVQGDRYPAQLQNRVGK